jgi:hypothetical protein
VRVLGPVAAAYALLVLGTSITLGRYPRPEMAICQCVFDEEMLQISWHAETYDMIRLTSIISANTRRSIWRQCRRCGGFWGWQSTSKVVIGGTVKWGSTVPLSRIRICCWKKLPIDSQINKAIHMQTTVPHQISTRRAT